MNNLVTAVGALPCCDDQVCPIVRNVGGVAPVGIIRLAIDRRVFFLRCTQAMKKNGLVCVQRLELRLVTRRRIAAVVEARTVLCPRQARELEPVEFFLEHLAGVDFENVPLRQSEPPS